MEESKNIHSIRSTYYQKKRYNNAHIRYARFLVYNIFVEVVYFALCLICSKHKLFKFIKKIVTHGCLRKFDDPVDKTLFETHYMVFELLDQVCKFYWIQEILFLCKHRENSQHHNRLGRGNSCDTSLKKIFFSFDQMSYQKLSCVYIFFLSTLPPTSM